MNFTQSQPSRQPPVPPQGSLLIDLKLNRVNQRLTAIRWTCETRTRVWLTKLEALRQEYVEYEVLEVIDQEIQTVQRITVLADRR